VNDDITDFSFDRVTDRAAITDALAIERTYFVDDDTGRLIPTIDDQ